MGRKKTASQGKGKQPCQSLKQIVSSKLLKMKNMQNEEKDC
jgi:hypothetical protein